MTPDRRVAVAALAVAAAAATGAWAARPVPSAVLVVTVVGAGLRRTVGLTLLVSLMATSWAGARAADGLHVVDSGPLDGWVTLADDPVPFGPAVRVIVRWDGRRYVAWARGGDGRRVLARSAGERVEMSGTLRSGADAWLRVRHVAGELSVDEVGEWRPGARLATAANRVRHLLEAGLVAVPPSARPLASGLIYGDDRLLDAEVVDRFRASGLGHLTAVSGQNLAVLLALVEPALARLGRGGRLATVLGAVGLFVLVTRAEPSVIRAGAMAAARACGDAVGRPVRPVVCLSGSIVGLLVLDPFLVRSVGFALSVSATAGIVAFASPLADRLRGPRWLAESLAVSLAAQLGVLPVSVAAFGQVQPIGPLANVLAVPVAGAVMVWGMAAGPVAGLIPGLAPVLHLPTRLGVWWVDSVARVAAGVPLAMAGALVVGLLSTLVRSGRVSDGAPMPGEGDDR